MSTAPASRVSPGAVRAVGFIALLFGALDPLEGSWVVLAGAVAVALVGHPGRPARERRREALAAVLVALGVAAMWILSSMGGFGGTSGRSALWVSALMPYPVGWLLALSGPGRPRWAAPAATGIGLWYLAIALLGLRLTQGDPTFLVGLGIFGAGVTTFAGLLTWRQRRAG